MEEEWKKLLLCSYFRHISLCFHSNYEREILLDVEFNSTSNEYPHCILLTDPTTPKIRNTWKNVMMKHREICWKYKQKSSFFHSSSKINNYYFIIFLRRPILDLKFSLMNWLWAQVWCESEINLEGYVDSDWVGSAIDRKITLGCCFNMGSCVIFWFSRK